VLGISNLIYSVLQQFGVVLSTAAQEHYRYEIQGYTLAANNQLADPTFGLAAIKTELDGIGLAITALGNPQQAATPVTLPAVAPAGYGGLSGPATASAVWSATFPGHSDVASFYLINAGLFAVNLGVTEMRVNLADQMRWHVYGPWTDDTGPDLPNRDVPDLDPNTILPTDANIADWINRVQPGYGATLTPEGWATIPDGGAYAYLYDLSPWEFLWIRANNPPAPLSINVAPIWPGLSGVTLGVPHDITAPGEVVSGSLDGLLLDITGVPSWAGKFDFGGATSWRNIGAVSFTSDNGQEEFPQTMGFSNNVILPKSMAHASGYVYRAAVGVTGTLTPFTIN
jgi:hypothetical protein